MSSFNLLFLPGDIFGLLALFFISFTSVFMLVRKKLLKLTKNLDLLRRIHILFSALGGLFLILHIAYFITYPMTSAIALGYVATAAALAVWLTGTAFLERVKDTLFYHGPLSLAAISLMVIHGTASGASINVPIEFAYVAIALTSAFALYKAYGHASKALKSSGENKKKIVVGKA